MPETLLVLAAAARRGLVALLLAGTATAAAIAPAGGHPAQTPAGPGHMAPPPAPADARGPLAALAPPPAGPNPYAHARVTTRLLTGAGPTYGYEVLVNGRVLVTQPGIPGRPGNAGFGTPAEARRVAALVAGKVRANALPPTVTEAELRRLHAGQ